ncbi:MAG: MerR family transcriptional regulator [Clostridia bacterium]|nr:MerR family transcriptional regulator [Clostridia bacterium]
MIKIGDFSKLTKISIRMLRHYDEIGLLKPETVDRFSGYRYYSVKQLSDANRIRALREMGFGLSETAEIIMQYNDTEAIADFLEKKQKELERERTELNDRLTLIESAIERLRKDGKSMNYNVTVKTVPERYAACVRKTIASYDHEGELWAILRSETKTMKLQPDTAYTACAIFHDDGYKESDVDVEIQMGVVGKYEDTENVKFKTIPAVEVASTIHKGSYDSITDAYSAVMEWIAGNGYEICGEMFNIYHMSPAQTSNPDEQVTEICLPVRKAK